MLKSFRVLLLVVIIAGLAAGAAFGAGTVYGRTFGAKPNATTPPAGGFSSSATLGATGANNPSGIAGADGATRGGVRGAVESIEGDILTIKGTDGASTKVKLDSKVPIRKTVDGGQADLQAGVNVLISGDRGADGTVAATQVSIVPAGTMAPGAGPGLGPAGRQTPAAGATPGAASTPAGPGGGRRGDPGATAPTSR